MKKTLLCLATAAICLPTISSAAESGYFSLEDEGFKRFSLSIGALHVMPQGKAQPFKVNTAIYENYESKVGNIQASTVIDNLDPDRKPNYLVEGIVKIISALQGNVSGTISGNSYINGLSSWDNPGTGLEADDVTTVGIMSSYHFTDNLSVEVKGGIPPKVNIKGVGKIYAPFSATAKPLGGIAGNLDLKNNILITDLEQSSKAAEARAWTPAFELQYRFGETGINKFRPYVGVGLMYAYFNELKMDPGIEKDLQAAGHMIQNIINQNAGASLDKKDSNGKMKVNLKATDALAPIATVGFTYDFNDTWYAVASISYAHLQNETEITVVNENTGVELINSKADIEINPILGYAGIGIRF